MKPVALICFDFETTDANPQTTRAVQLAAIACIEGEEGHTLLMNEIVNPEVPISVEASHIHGITQEQVEQCRADTLACQDLVDRIFQLQNDYEVVLVGHNSWGFDLPILERLGTAILSHLPHIDTYIAATRLYPNAPNHKLSVADPEDQKVHGGPGLIQHLQLGSGEGAHDALADILMVAALAKHFCYDGPQPFGSYLRLADWMREPHVHEKVHFGKHKGKHWKDVPYGYMKFICDKFDNPTPDLVATVKHWHRMNFKNA